MRTIRIDRHAGFFSGGFDFMVPRYELCKRKVVVSRRVQLHLHEAGELSQKK